MPNIHVTNFRGSSFELIRAPILRCVGRCSNMPAYSIQMHNHPMAEMIYVLQGSGTVDIEGAVWPLQPGSIAIYNPFVMHAEKFDNQSTPIFFYHIKMDAFLISGLAVNCLLPPRLQPVFPAGKCGPSLERIFALMFAEAEAREAGYQQILNCSLQWIVVLTLRVLDSYFRKLDKDDNGSLLYQVQSYLAVHYAESLTMRSEAARFHISSYYLSHLMQKSLGRSPVAFLTAMRISEACRLLSQTSRPIQDIAVQVGYPNLSNFYVQFAKLKKTTPMKYRNEYGAGQLPKIQEGYQEPRKPDDGQKQT